MNDKIDLSNDDLEMLKVLLHTCKQAERFSSSIKYDNIIKYEYSVKESQAPIDLYEFRISRAVEKSSAIVNLIHGIKQNNEPHIIVHYLGCISGEKFMIYSNIDCNKIIGVLPFGSGEGNALIY